MSLNERDELLSAREQIMSDELLKQSPAYKQSPNIISDLLTFCETCSADTAFEILKQFQKTITVKLPDIKDGEPGVKEAREKLKIIERINSWWIWHYCICTYTDINPMLHVLTTDFTSPVLKRRSKKPKQPQQQQARRPRVDNRHSNNNHSPRTDSRRNVRSPWSNGNAYNNHTVPSKVIPKKWNAAQQRYI